MQYFGKLKAVVPKTFNKPPFKYFFYTFIYFISYIQGCQGIQWGVVYDALFLKREVAGSAYPDAVWSKALLLTASCLSSVSRM